MIFGFNVVGNFGEWSCGGGAGGVLLEQGCGVKVLLVNVGCEGSLGAPFGTFGFVLGWYLSKFEEMVGRGTTGQDDPLGLPEGVGLSNRVSTQDPI